MVGSWEREKSVDFPFNFQSGRNWCLLSIIQRSRLLLLKVLSEDQQPGLLPGNEEICSISGPTPGPLSQNLHFQRNPQWFTSNSLSFIFPTCKIEIIKANWQIYLGLNKMISIQRVGISFFFFRPTSPFQVSGCEQTCPAFDSELEKEKGLLVPSPLCLQRRQPRPRWSRWLVADMP